MSCLNHDLPCVFVDVGLADILEEETEFGPCDCARWICVDQLEEGLASTAGGDVAVPTFLLQFCEEWGDFTILDENKRHVITSYNGAGVWDTFTYLVSPRRLKMNSAPFPFCGAVEKLRGLVHSPIDDDDGAANERNANFLPVSPQVMADTERNIAKFLFQEGAVLSAVK